VLGRNKLTALAALALSGCATLEMPSPISLPSICMGDVKCEARKNAETLATMGFPDAGLVIMCGDTQVRGVLEVECGSDALPYP
jgi:hypothetical protein